MPRSSPLLFSILISLGTSALTLDTSANDKSHKQRLDKALAMQEEDVKKRYIYRKPKETLMFFGVRPGMTVAEIGPGGGWYSKILIPYLGSEGTLIGIDYERGIWHHFSPDNAEERIEKRKTWPQEWEKKAGAWFKDGGARVKGMTLGMIPESAEGSVDAVLFFRALHGMSRYESKGQFLSNAIKDSNRLLKKGGIVGVVQHQAKESKTDEWADGSQGYLKKSSLVKAFEKGGFTLVAESDINENPKDQPGEEDFVWRLPPTLGTSKNDEALRNKYQTIGESNRMTLLFKKL